MKLPSNILASFAVSLVLSALIYVINVKRNDDEINKRDLLKISLLGCIVGGSNYLLFSNSESVPVINQEIMTGMPDF